MSKLVFLSGAISGITSEEAYQWRSDMKNQIETLEAGWKAFNPMDHFDINSLYCQSRYGSNEKMDDLAFDIDLAKLRKSDVVICDMSRPSLGTAAELGIAHELRIPIVGICPENKRGDLHPWWKHFATYLAKDYEDAMIFFVDHFINND